MSKIKKGDAIRRVGMIFSGGPAPAANSVIAAAATAFIEDGRDVMGFFHGYSSLGQYDKERAPLVADQHYRTFHEHDLRGLRNRRGIVIGTARANPGKPIKTLADLDNPEKTEGLKRVYDGLVDNQVDALISIGGDDTLKTANYLYEFQKRLPQGAPRVKVIHLPKTIDNDYDGIDFTFGFFTAVDTMAKQVMNLRADALATGSYFIVESMGRKAGWLAYGVAIAGEAHMVISLEDVDDSMCIDETAKDGTVSRKLSLDALSDKIVDLIITRETRNKHYGVVVLAEGLGDMLADKFLGHLPIDDHGHRQLGDINLGKLVAKNVSERYSLRTKRSKKATGIQMGYESRCAAPHAFDVILGSALGVGAYGALVEQGLDGHMVSVKDQFQLTYVPFSDLVDPKTLITNVRFIKPGCDYHRLARFLETRSENESGWSPGRRLEPWSPRST
jgi:6-phosphofructokinase 1